MNMAKKTKKEETPKEETPKDPEATDRTSTEPEVKESKGKVRVTATYLGQDIDRVYSKEVHGKDYEKLAKKFAEKVKGTIE